MGVVGIAKAIITVAIARRKPSSGARQRGRSGTGTAARPLAVGRVARAKAARAAQQLGQRQGQSEFVRL